MRKKKKVARETERISRVEAVLRGEGRTRGRREGAGGWAKEEERGERERRKPAKKQINIDIFPSAGHLRERRGGT